MCTSKTIIYVKQTSDPVIFEQNDVEVWETLDDDYCDLICYTLYSDILHSLKCFMVKDDFRFIRRDSAENVFLQSLERFSSFRNVGLKLTATLLALSYTHIFCIDTLKRKI